MNSGLTMPRSDCDGPCYPCAPPCNVCSGNLVPDKMYLIGDGWGDATCYCPPGGTPTLVSQFSSLNGTFEATLVPGRCESSASACFLWYEGTFNWGTLIFGGTDCDDPPAWDESANQILGGVCRFAIAVSAGSGTRQISVYFYAGTDTPPLGFFGDGELWIGAFDVGGTTAETAWVCTGGEGEVLYDSGATDPEDGTQNIRVGDGSDDPAEYRSAEEIFLVEPCSIDGGAETTWAYTQGTMHVGASSTLISLAA